MEENKNRNKNKIVELAIKQNLLLWQVTKSFLDIEKKIIHVVDKSN